MYNSMISTFHKSISACRSSELSIELVAHAHMIDSPGQWPRSMVGQRLLNTLRADRERKLRGDPFMNIFLTGRA